MSIRLLYLLDGEPGVPVIGSVPNNTDLGPLIATTVGVGNPWYVWADPNLSNDILTADEIGADFNEAPLASADYQTNRAAAAALIETPPLTGEGGVVWVVV